MIAAYKKKAKSAALIFVIGIAVLIVVQRPNSGSLVTALLNLCAWVSLVAFICSCWFYLKAKGRSGWWTLLLSFTIVGLICFALMKDLAKDGVSDPELLAKAQGGWPVWAGIAGGGFLAIGIEITVIGTIRGSNVARNMEQASIPLIAALETFHTERASYPAKLADLVPAYIDSLPRCYENDKQPVGYFLADNTEYTLTCHTYFVQRHSYSSKTRKWYDWD